MKHLRYAHLVKMAREGRIETFNDIRVGKLIEVRYTATGRVVWVQVEP